VTLERRFRSTLLATALISLAAFGAAEQSAGLCVLALVAAVAGWWVTERHGGPGAGGRWKGLPRWVTSLVLFVMLAIALGRAVQGQREVVSAFTGFLASIIVVKLWEKRELRDYAQILAMSLFMTVGATLDNNTLLIGLLLLVQVPVFVMAVMLFQVYAAGERVKSASWQDRDAESSPSAEWTKAQRRAFAAACAGTVLSGAAIAIMVFILVPRGIGLQQWGDFARPLGRQTTGFTDEVEPGSGEVISASQVAVMEVSFQDEGLKYLGGFEQPYYLRGAVLDSYDAPHGKWVRSKAEQSVRSKVADTGQELRLNEKSPSGTLVNQTVTELTGVRGDTPMFALYQPIAVMLTRVEQAEEVTYNTGSGWIVRHGDGSRVTYNVKSIVDLPGPEGDKRGLISTFPSEKIHGLAVDLLNKSQFEPDPSLRPRSEDGRASRVFETFLRNNYEYTLSPGPAPAGQPSTEYFLFSSRRGHCEYFASALCAMCRSVGIEARVVAGYLVNEYHPDRDSYVVRASDAHAWVEVNTGQGGWQRRDATPADSLRSVQDSRKSLLATFQRLTASLQDLWNAAVVTFDQSTQEKLLGQGGEGSQRTFFESRVRDAQWMMRRMRGQPGAPGAWAARIMVLGAVFLVGGMSWVGVRAARRRAAQSAGESGWAMLGPERQAYRELLSLLAQRGYPKPAWQPPMQHLRAVALREGPLAGAASEVVALLYRARFGGGSGEDLTAAKRRLKALRHELNGGKA
jgi:hypothetical protein